MAELIEQTAHLLALKRKANRKPAAPQGLLPSLESMLDAASPLELYPAPLPHRMMPGVPHDVMLVDDDVWVNSVACCQHGTRWPLVYLGSVGGGKSCAALCLLDIVAGARRYMTVAQLCDEVIDVQQGRRQYGGTPDTPSRWWTRWRELKGLPVLDEIGARERVSDHHYECLKRAMDERAHKPALYISNLGLDGIAQVYDDRIASRLAAGTVIEFKGKDRRLA